MPITDACGTGAMRLANRERDSLRRDPAARDRVERIRHETNIAGLESYLERRRRRLRERPTIA